MPLYRSNNIQIDTVNSFNSKIVLVSFTERRIDQHSLEAQGFGQDFARKLGIDGAYVKCADNGWYQYPEMQEAIDAIKKHVGTEKSIVTYGSSMGAYAALKFAQRLRAKRAVAISPLFSPDPNRAPYEKRWKADADRITFIDDQMMRDSTDETEVFILTDPSHPDAKHARLLRTAFGRTRVIAVPFASHPVGPFLRETKLLSDLLGSIIVGDFDNRQWCNQRRANRKHSPSYQARLDEIMISRRSRLGLLMES